MKWSFKEHTTIMGGAKEWPGVTKYSFGHNKETGEQTLVELLFTLTIFICIFVGLILILATVHTSNGFFLLCSLLADKQTLLKKVCPFISDRDPTCSGHTQIGGAT